MSDTKQLEALRDEQAAGVGAATVIWPTDDPRIDVMTAQLAATDRAIARLRAEQPQESKPLPVPGEGAALIAAERRRQVTHEGWTPEHDDEHDGGELAAAAACYALSASPAAGNSTDFWPWHPRWWKPKSRMRDLVRAGALIAAEIDRLQRQCLPLPPREQPQPSERPTGKHEGSQCATCGELFMSWREHKQHLAAAHDQQPSERSAPEPVGWAIIGDDRKHLAAVTFEGRRPEPDPNDERDDAHLYEALALHSDLVAALAEVERLKAQLAAAQREPDARWVLGLDGDGDPDVLPDLTTSEFRGELRRLLAGRERVTLRVYVEERGSNGNG